MDMFTSGERHDIIVCKLNIFLSVTELNSTQNFNFFDHVKGWSMRRANLSYLKIYI